MKARVVRAWMALGWATTLVGCSNLLPRSSVVAPSAFNSFEAARDALERTVPYSTTTAQMRELGFDIQASANVSLIPYPQVITRLAPNPIGARVLFSWTSSISVARLK
jgi:hypothetical protein